MWHHCLHNLLIENNFIQLACDNCIYIRGQGKQKVILIVWVNDLVIASSCTQAAESIKEQLSRRFKMKDFGVLSNFLGIQFQILDSSIKMHQSDYTIKILDRFQMLDCNPRSIPCDLSTANIDFNENSILLDDPRLYREIVGSLIYLMTCRRPDLCFVVTVLSQFFV